MTLLCVYVSMCVCMCTRVHGLCTHVCTCAGGHEHACVPVRVGVHKCEHRVCTCAWACASMCGHAQVCVCEWTHMSMRVCMCAGGHARAVCTRVHVRGHACACTRIREQTCVDMHKLCVCLPCVSGRHERVCARTQRCMSLPVVLSVSSAQPCTDLALGHICHSRLTGRCRCGIWEGLGVGVGRDWGAEG